LVASVAPESWSRCRPTTTPSRDRRRREDHRLERQPFERAERRDLAQQAVGAEAEAEDEADPRQPPALTVSQTTPAAATPSAIHCARRGRSPSTP
jgi:hypothetical protein